MAENWAYSECLTVSPSNAHKMESFQPIELEISGNVHFEENLVPTNFYQNLLRIGAVANVYLYHLQMPIKGTIFVRSGWRFQEMLEHLAPTNFYQNRPKMGPKAKVYLFHLQIPIK